MAAFFPALVERARREGWLLLLVLTSWRAEWRGSAAAGEAPATIAGEGDLVHELGRAEGLEAAITLSFADLPEEQRAALAAKADGNPSLLDEMLMFLDRHPRLFVDRDPSGALTLQGLAEALAGCFSTFAADRLRATPDYVRRALAIVSLQGIAFSPRLVRRVAEGLRVVDAARGLAEGDNSHSFVLIGAEGEFRLGPYRDAAYEDLANHFDEAEAEAALAWGLREAAAALADANERELLLVIEAPQYLWDDEAAQQVARLAVFAELIERANAKFDARAAGALARRAMPQLTADGVKAPLYIARAIVDADMAWAGVGRDHAGVFQAVVETLRRRIEAQPTPGARRGLALALANLGGVVQALEGPAAARFLRQEDTATCRALAEAQPTSQAALDLAGATDRLAGCILCLEEPASVVGLRQEAIGLTAAAHSALSGAASHLWLLAMRRRSLTDALLGDAPWRRAFAVEVAIGADPEIAAGLASLRDEFRSGEAR